MAFSKSDAINLNILLSYICTEPHKYTRELHNRDDALQAAVRLNTNASRAGVGSVDVSTLIMNFPQIPETKNG